MSLKVVEAELLKQLDIQTAYFVAQGYTVGLFQNDWTPANTDTISAVTAATFSGYSGLELLTGPTSATWVSPRALSNFDPIVWTHNGGGTSNSIYGYYVVDGGGALAWGERLTGGPVTIGVNGQTYTVTPQYTRRSEF